MTEHLTATIPSIVGTHKTDDLTNDKKRKRAVLPKPTRKSKSVETKNCRSLVYKYTLDPYDYCDDELFEMSVEMFRHFQLLEKFYLDEQRVLSFMQSVRDMYTPSNHFHNFKHAWGVMHMSFQLLLLGASKCLRDIDILAILLSAVCHDVGHPGNNNAFEIATESEVSKKYRLNDEICVLERYHSALTKMLLSSDSDLLQKIGDDAKDKLLEEIDYIIMGTDMAKHSSLVVEAQEYAKQLTLLSEQELNTELTCRSDESGCTTAPSTPTSDVLYHNKPTSSSSFSSSSSSTPSNFLNHTHDDASDTVMVKRLCKLFPDDSSRRAFARLLIHTADIGAQTQDLPVAGKWVWRCYNEFRLQADKESDLGIMTSPFLHDLKEDSKIYKSQHFFISDIVEPIWRAMAQLLPPLTFACEQLVTNKTHYQTYYATPSTSTSTSS